MPVTQDENGVYYDSKGQRYSSYSDAAKGDPNINGPDAGDVLLSGISKGVGNYFKNKANESSRNRERERYQREVQAAVQQVYDLYKAGKIDEAINCCNGLISEYGKELKPLLPIMLYRQGRYKEAIAYGQPLIISLCYEKMGDKQKATETLYKTLKEMCNSDHCTEFDEYSSLLGSVFYENSDFYYLNDDYLQMHLGRLDKKAIPFDFEYSEIIPLVTARAEEGNKKFYKFMGDMHRCVSIEGMKSDYESAKKWYEKAMENNDSEAFFTVAKFLLDGKYGYEKNRSLAIEYLKKAISLGHTEAEDALDEAMQRNRYVSLLFGLVGAVGSLGFFNSMYQKLGLDNIALLTFGCIGTIIAGGIITYKAWTYRKNILFIIMMSISVIGFIGVAGGGGTSNKNKNVQNATVTANSLEMYKQANMYSNVIKTLEKGDTVTIRGRQDNGYMPVIHGKDKGFVATSKIEINEKTQNSDTGTSSKSLNKPAEGIDNLIQQAANNTSGKPVTAKITLQTPLRAEPNGDSSAYLYIKKGKTVTLTGKKQKGTFRSNDGEIELESAEVVYSGYTGWVTVRYLKAP